jgi:hypothetical protein
LISTTNWNADNISGYYDGNQGHYQQEGYYEGGHQGYQDEYYNDQYYDQGGANGQQGYAQNDYGSVKYLNEPFLVANLLIERSQSAVATTPRRTPKPLVISQ